MTKYDQIEPEMDPKGLNLVKYHQIEPEMDPKGLNLVKYHQIWGEELLYMSSWLSIHL
jgi:Fe-S-cluster formation regulator IscX/YfhJ